jgi:lysophospholipase L1-like esterase
VSLALLALLSGGARLSASADTVQSRHLTISLIGDSIAADLAKKLRDPSFGGPSGVTWKITAQPGAGWGEGENAQGNWPLGVVQGDSVKRRVEAAAKEHPSVIAIELGTNDALRAAFSFTLNNGTQLAARIDGTDGNIRSVVKLASSLSPCVVLVSPSDDPTSVFGAEEHYSATSLQLRLVLLKEISKISGHSVLLADWAVLSSMHRPADGSSQNWFTGDGLHPNTAGLRAMASLIVRTARSCPS